MFARQLADQDKRERQQQEDADAALARAFGTGGSGGGAAAEAATGSMAYAEQLQQQERQKQLEQDVALAHSLAAGGGSGGGSWPGNSNSGGGGGGGARHQQYRGYSGKLTLVKDESGKAGLLELLVTALQAQCNHSPQRRAECFVIEGPILFFEQHDGWSCGYRNIQMMASYIVMGGAGIKRGGGGGGSGGAGGSKGGGGGSDADGGGGGGTSASTTPEQLFPSFDGIVTINGIQQCIERAWHGGWDPGGRNHFSGTLCGKKEWIGASEAAVLFRSLRMRVRWVDFGSQRGAEAGAEMVKWTWQYFQGGAPAGPRGLNSAVQRTKRSPLYLQHQGHSRTIVGIEKARINGRDDYLLLVLDPAKKSRELVRSMQARAGWQGLIKRKSGSFPKKEYSIMYFAGEMREEEMARARTAPMTSDERHGF